ncbi:hypothetical protein C0992_006352, partial [Termitomyces sp. T32_za158]
QYAAMAYPGCDEPLPYQTPVHLRMDVDEEGRYERQEEKGHHERVHHMGPSQPQGRVQSYACAVAQPRIEEYAPQAQMSMGTERLLGRLEAAGQPVPTTASFLQDNLAVMVMEGLLDQIELMRRQCVTALEQIERAAKRKLTGYKGASVEPKQARLQPPQPVEAVQAVVPMADCPVPAVVLTTSTLPARPPATPVQAAPTVSRAPKVDAEMIDAPVNQDKMALMDAIEAGVRTRVPILQVAGPSTQGLAMSSHAPAMQAPSRLPRGRKPPLKIEDMELVDFPAGVPARADFVQFIFMSPIVVPMPAAQFNVVIVATDPCTPAQYDVVPTKEDNSDYGQSSSEAEEEEEEGKTPAQHFQRVQRNKKLAKKKANRAQAAAALAHRAQNDFSGCIPDGLGVKIWGPLDVEGLNSCFRGALGPSFYYLYRTNMVFMGADANHVAAFEFGSGRAADMPRTMVYKFVCRGFPCTPYELERLYKYCANPHVPHRNRIAVFMLLIKMQLFVQHLDTALQDRMMRLLLDDPVYQDIPNPIMRPEDMAFVKHLHIPARFLRTKDDGMTALRVMRAPDPKKPFDLEQIAQYTLIYSRPGLENTWQGIVVDFAYRMHWRTLFGFALCRALCTNSAGKTMLVHWFALVMVQPGLYREAVAAYAAANPTCPFVAQYGTDIEICQVHVPDDQRLSVYGTPPAIPHWDGWREISEEDCYRLLFKRTNEVAAQIDTEGLGLYYYIGMDPNVGQLWKQTPAHGTMPVIGPAINIALTNSIMVDATAAGGPLTPPKTESGPQPPAINIAQPEAATTTEAGGAQTTTGMG